ncbi:hypothetical protein NHG29_01655 [Aerococcaceae bacterium NML160702]|nr:hypothetical protein [Aerococcaceae bacterium NML160702]
MMMKKYNFKKARKIINVLADELVRADMGIVSDWYSTAETVWSKEDGFLVNLSRTKELGGLQGSYRGTPSLELLFKDGSEITIDCYVEEER